MALFLTVQFHIVFNRIHASKLVENDIESGREVEMLKKQPENICLRKSLEKKKAVEKA